jgi:hypothetical protein
MEGLVIESWVGFAIMSVILLACIWIISESIAPQPLWAKLILTVTTIPIAYFIIGYMENQG